MDEIKAQKKALKKAYKQAKRKNVLAWKILTILCAVVMVISVPLSVLAVKFDNTMAARFGGSFWKLQNEDTNAQYYTSDFNSAEEMVDYGLALTQQVEAEGAALLMNNNNALPLAADAKVSTFSNSSVNLVYGGTGSGNIDASTADTLRTALEKVGVTVNPTLWDFYTVGAGKDYARSKSGTVATASEVTAEVPWDVYTDDVKNSVAQYGDAAIVTLSRVGGEGADLAYGEVNYLALDENEKAMLQNVAEMKKNGIVKKTIVLINSANALQVDFLKNNEYDIDAALWIGDVGISGINAVAEILTGKVNPSGSLVDTYCYDNFSAPAMWNFTPTTYEGYVEGGDVPAKSKSYMIYQEGIYVGYKYYETRYEDFVTGSGNAGDYAYGDIVAYPFGYGLSYTSFDWKVTDASANGATLTKDGDVTVKVTVTNTGDRAGKDVVQLYYTAPYIAGEIEKSSVELGAFAKTKELQPGESEEVTLTIPVSDMASYDAYDANHNGFTGYELDAGDYIFTVRHDAHDVDDDAAATITCNLPANIQYAEDTVTGNPVSNKFTGSDAIDGVSLDGSDSNQNITYMTRADFAGTFPKTNTPSRAMTDNVKALNLYTADMANGYINEADEAITTGAKNGLKIEDNGKTTDLGFQLGADFNDPQWDALLDELTVNEMENMYINAYGGLAELKSVGKTKSKDADGPSQIGGFTGMGAGTGFPSSSTLAQTWNGELAQEEGRTIGTQALQNGYTGWYAPATNMHRSPFNGRNYEYYSEDSLLSGVICGNTVQGANDAGVYTYVKHFICNDGESGIYRDSVYTWMTEQALREIYLRPFQMLVEDYDAVGLMSSYNRIGAVWAGGSEALLTGILRDEWGFDGAVITDYCDHHSYMNGDQALRAGGSLWMAGFIGGKMAFETGSNSYLQALRRAAKQTLYMYLHVRVTNRDYAESIGDTTALRHDFKPAVLGWRHLVALIDLVAVALFALAIRGIVRDVKLYKAAKAARAENKNA